MCVQIFIQIGWVVSEKLALQKRFGRVGPGRVTSIFSSIHVSLDP